MPRRPHLPDLLLFTVSLALALVIAEAILRLLDRPPAVRVGWKFGKPPAPANELGFRGHLATGPGTGTIVLLGDSQVESVTEADAMPEVFLAQALARQTGAHLRVLTIGTGGWGQDQELLALERYLGEIRPKPRMVCLWFTPRNDLWNNVFPTNFTRTGWPKPTFWLEGADLRGPTAGWLEAYRRTPVHLLGLVDRVWRGRVHPSDDEWESRLPPAYHNDTVPMPGTPSLKTYMAARRGVREEDVPYWWGENFETEKNHYSVFFTPASPRLRYAAALTHALLLRIATLCRVNGIEFLAFYRRESSLFPEEPTDFVVDGRVFTLSLRAADALLREVFAGLPVLPLGDFAENAFVPADDHLNATGNRLAMERLAEFLRARYPRVVSP